MLQYFPSAFYRSRAELPGEDIPPAPVMIPQPRGANVSKGKSLLTLTRQLFPTRARLANELCPKKCEVIDSPVLEEEYAFEPSPRPTPKLSLTQSLQHDVSCLSQYLQFPQQLYVMMTWSPSATFVTFAPVFRTTPAPDNCQLLRLTIRVRVSPKSSSGRHQADIYIHTFVTKNNRKHGRHLRLLAEI